MARWLRLMRIEYRFSWRPNARNGARGGADFPQISAAANSQYHLIWIACGTEDRLITTNRKIVAFLKEKGVHVTPIETPGMHTWLVWRRNLIAFAPLLFQNDMHTVRPAIISGQN